VSSAVLNMDTPTVVSTYKHEMPWAVERPRRELNYATSATILRRLSPCWRVRNFSLAPVNTRPGPVKFLSALLQGQRRER
jgi:hypothetical protein